MTYMSGNLPVSHLAPLYSGVQVQLNPTSVSVHVPPFLHVSGVHEITSAK